MLNPLITVIVPVFNVSPFLERCVDSIRSQLLSNIEMILVDDGSTDDSGAICDHFAAIDNRVKCIHKPNGGVSSARNAGLKLAQGDLVSFVDADDWVEKDFLSHLYSILVDGGADIAACGMLRHASGEEPTGVLEAQPVVVDRLAGMIGCICSISLFANTCNRLYRRDTIRNVWFSENMSYGEDNLFNFFAYSNASRSVMDQTPKYHYIQREGSATATRDRLGEDRLFMIEEIRRASQGDPDRAAIIPHVEARHVMDIVQLLINITRAPRPQEHRTERLRHSGELRGLAVKAIANPVLPPKFKLSAALALIHPALLHAYLRFFRLLESWRQR